MLCVLLMFQYFYTIIFCVCIKFPRNFANPHIKLFCVNLFWQIPSFFWQDWQPRSSRWPHKKSIRTNCRCTHIISKHKKCCSLKMLCKSLFVITQTTLISIRTQKQKIKTDLYLLTNDFFLEYFNCFKVTFWYFSLSI